MSASLTNALRLRIHAVAGRALGQMPVRPRDMSTVTAAGNVVTWGTTNASCAHVTAKPAAKAGYITPIGDGIRLPRGTG